MLTRVDRVTSESLGRLNRKSLERPAEIRALLGHLRERRIVLRNGINHRNDPRSARIKAIADDRVTLSTANLDQEDAAQLFLNFELDDTSYFFAARPIRWVTSSTVVIEFPRAVYQAERRDLHREEFDPESRGQPSVELRSAPDTAITAPVANCSQHGLGIDLPADEAVRLPSQLTVCFLEGARRGEAAMARVRHRPENRDDGSGWVRIGLSLTQAASDSLLPVDRRDRILPRRAAGGVRNAASLLSVAVRAAPARVARNLGLRRRRLPEVPLEEYRNQRGERICAIVDSWGDPRGAPAVVIPPAWGRTKETLLPLAATVVETFRRAQQPVSVLRFDGTHRRGESYIDPKCRLPGNEYLRFTFSQAARDIQATVDFLYGSPRYRPSTVILVTFSLAAIEGRHALSLDAEGRIGGWVSVVGMVDLQSSLRTISGGIDYAYGLVRGVRFGRHELVGVVIDVDHGGLDAIEKRMVFMEDARREMARIRVPVTWLHGKHDAWMDLERVRSVLSCGDWRNRKLIEVPTGHQLRTSREALATFQLVAEEVSEMALGRRFPAAPPPLAWLERRSQAERERRPRVTLDRRRFWTDYLLGRDRRLGMQLLTATAAYRNFMAAQVQELQLRPGQRIADLGAGTGEFSLHLARRGGLPSGVKVDEVDYVSEALQRGGIRLDSQRRDGSLSVARILADLEVSKATAMPFSDAQYDAVLASLIISYLDTPDAFLREVHRILKPGGRLVLSTLQPDADISKLFVDGLAELKPPSKRRSLGEISDAEFEALTRDFLNDASKILDLEETGHFRFWTPEELCDLASSVGFVDLSTRLSLGEPAQAVLLTAHRCGAVKAAGRRRPRSELANRDTGFAQKIQSPLA